MVNCSARSKGSCPVITKPLSFKPEACSLSSCVKSTRLSFSLDHLQELTSTTWDLECSVKLCHGEVQWVRQLFLHSISIQDVKSVFLVSNILHECSWWEHLNVTLWVFIQLFIYFSSPYLDSHVDLKKQWRGIWRLPNGLCNCQVSSA